MIKYSLVTPLDQVEQVHMQENRTGGIKWHATHKINQNKIILHKEQEVTNNNNNTIINNNN